MRKTYDISKIGHRIILLLWPVKVLFTPAAAATKCHFLVVLKDIRYNIYYIGTNV